jgi:uncharacterized protein YxeA
MKKRVVMVGPDNYLTCQWCGFKYHQKAGGCPKCKSPQDAQWSQQGTPGETRVVSLELANLKTSLNKPMKTSEIIVILVFVIIFVAGFGYYDNKTKKEEVLRIQKEQAIKVQKQQEKIERERAYRQRQKEREIQRKKEKEIKENNPTYIKHGEKPTTTYDGKSCIEVELYLKRALNDPESLIMSGCSQPSLVNEGWLVICSYRARNAFGGMVRKTAAFVVNHGSVSSYNEF